jgi:hypothetical protein
MGMHPELLYAYAHVLIDERRRTAAHHMPPAFVRKVDHPASGRPRLHRLLHKLVGVSAGVEHQQPPGRPGQAT